MGSTQKAPDGVSTYPADAWDIDSYRQVEETVARMRIQWFRDRANSLPSSRIFRSLVQKSSMKRLIPLCAAVLFSLTSAGCHSTMSTSSDRPADEHRSAEPGYSNAVNHWPLVFRAHWFGSDCFSTRSCKVLYAGMPEGAMIEGEEHKPRPSLESYGIPLEKLLRGGRGPIPNFPPPAVVDWRSADGVPHHAEIDIGEIFKDQLVRHNVPREEVGATYDPQPEIILEVNDRTINVYMRATIYTKHEQIPGNKYSDMRHELIKAFSRTY
jgi:hypothetical protein